MTTFIENEPPNEHFWLYLYTIIIAVIMAAVFLCSCTSTKYIPIIEREYISRADTITRYDSIYISQIDTILIKGDSVTTIKWRNEYRYIDRYKTRIDTIFKSDTISVPMPVESSLTWWQRAKVATWPYVLVAFVVVSAILIWLIKRKSVL